MDTADTPSLLLLDLTPDSSLAGIDLLSFSITSRFRGVKNLTPGFHFVFAGTSTAFSERHGLWFFIEERHTAPQDMFITKWDSALETLVAETDATELLRWRANLGSIWHSALSPYRQPSAQTHAQTPPQEDEEESNDWLVLTSAITRELLARITKNSSDWRLSSASSAKRDLEDIPGLSKNDRQSLIGESELGFLQIDLKQTWREGATGRERTEAAQDRSWAVDNLVATQTGGNIREIIGEMQFTFLMVLTINNFSCLEQWKRILELIFTCRKAVSSQPDFFINAIAALRLQLQHCKDAEGGLIDLADESGSLLKSLLVRFRKNLESLSGAGISDVADELDDLEDFLRQEHGWQFGGDFARSGVLELDDGEQVTLETSAYDEEDETGEFAPQIVELTPEQARMLHMEASVRELHGKLSKASLRDGAQNSVQSAIENEDVDGADKDEDEEMQDLEEMDSRF